MDTNISFTGQKIYENLKEEILTLKIRPGEKISENDICERFNVSRTPVRTAFQRLNNDGLLTIEPYKTTYASLLNLEQIKQLIYMRYAIESMVLRDFLAVMEPMTIEKIRYRLRQQEVLLSGNFEAEEFYILDAKLHSIWFHQTKKDGLWQYIQGAQANYTRFRMLDMVAVKNFRQILDEHLELFTAIENKDSSSLDAIVKKHVYGGINRLGEKLTTEFTGYFLPH